MPGRSGASSEPLIRAIAALWTPPAERLQGWVPEPLPAVAWEIILRPGGASSWHLTCPAPVARAIAAQAQAVWPTATVQECPDPLAGIEPVAAGIAELARHYVFPLRSDRRTAAPLPSLLEITRQLGDGDAVALQVLMTPAPPDWWAGAVSAYEQYRRGRMPSRPELTPAAVAQGLLRAAAAVNLELVALVSELLTGERPEILTGDDESLARVLRERPDGAKIAHKLRGDAVDVTVRAAVQSADPVHARTVLHAVAWALRELDADNALRMRDVAPERLWPAMLSRSAPVKLMRDYLSTWEAAQLVQLPSPALQEEYGIDGVRVRESELPPELESGGLYMGTVRFRGDERPVYIPTSDVDELCLPRLVIGGMGTGKTRGFGANFAAEAVRAGYTVVIFDPAKGEIGDELEAALPRERVRRIRLGERPVALDWREALHSPRARNRLAAEMLSFFAAAAVDETGAQTARFLRAAAKAAPRGRLSEIVRLLTDNAYREELLPAMPPHERAVWTAFGELSDARRAQITMPVLNRLDVILGDDYLAACMEAEHGLDFVEMLDTPGTAWVIDAPKSLLGAEALDVLGALASTKADLAMTLRRRDHPAFLVWDEPHQYVRSARTWRAAAVESRKWRVGYVWMLHSWEQLPRDVAEIIRAALPHYHLYPSSPATFRALAAELAPWTPEEALKIPRYHALHVLRVGGRTVPPFVARMAPPPSKRRAAG